MAAAKPDPKPDQAERRRIEAIKRQARKDAAMILAQQDSAHPVGSVEFLKQASRLADWLDDGTMPK